MKKLVFLAAAISFSVRAADSPAASPSPADSARGTYFAIKKYEPGTPLPTFATLKDRLPSPVFDENPDFVQVYWKTWEIACRNFKEPRPGSGLVSQYVDAAFNGDIFLWDTCFMTMFYNLAHPLTPGIGSLDNFYARQHDDGEICREIVAKDGKDFWSNDEGKKLIAKWGFDPHHRRLARIPYIGRPAPEPASRVTLDGLDNPLPAWAEMESYRVTGDRDRLKLVYPPLVKYYEAFRQYVRQGNGLYLTCWSSMDNSPRNAFLHDGGCGVDTSSQMVLFARELAEMARILDLPQDAARFTAEANATAAIINRLMWDPEKKFYYDVTGGNERIPVKTVAGFWPLLAGIASPDQAAALVAELNNPATFKRVNRVPTLAADQEGYVPGGDYWRGSVWAPTTTMVIRGLERYGYGQLAREIALNQVSTVAAVFHKTGTVWENYAPDSVARGSDSRKDFVGWTGIVPILYFLEFEIGLKPDAQTNTLVWELNATKRVGCERYRFNGHLADLIATPGTDGWNISVTSDGNFTLVMKEAGGAQTSLAIHAGPQSLHLPAPPTSPEAKSPPANP